MDSGVFIGHRIIVTTTNQSLWLPLFSRCAKSDWIYWILSIVLCTHSRPQLLCEIHISPINISPTYLWIIIATLLHRKRIFAKYLFSLSYLCNLLAPQNPMPLITYSGAAVQEEQSEASSSVALLVVEPWMICEWTKDVCSPQSDRVPSSFTRRRIAVMITTPMDVWTGQVDVSLIEDKKMKPLIAMHRHGEFIRGMYCK